MKEEIRNIPIEKLKVSKYNVRKEEITEGEEFVLLVESIRKTGLLQPLVVTPSEDGDFEILCGQRRFLAAREAGLKSLPCIIKTSLTTEEKLLLSLTENVARKNLNPIERAKAIQQLYLELKKKGKVKNLNDFIKKYGRVLGLGRTQIYNSFKLLQLDEETQRKIASGSISPEKILREFSGHRKDTECGVVNIYLVWGTQKVSLKFQCSHKVELEIIVEEVKKTLSRLGLNEV